MLTTSADGTARVWTVDLDQLLELSRTIPTRELTEEERRRYRL